MSLYRTRVRLTQERTRLVNRIQKVLEDANIKLASVISDVMGVTGQAILRALLAGQEDPEYLSRLARGTLVRKEDQLQAALQGKLTSHHRMQLEELFQLITTLDRSIARFDREVAERLRWLDPLIERIDAVTGLSRCSIEVLLGELGWDMSHFPDAACNAGCELLFLPPYSPDFTPIEQAFSKIKAILRGLGARIRDALVEAIRLAVDAITCDDAVAWFTHAGYSLPAESS